MMWLGMVTVATCLAQDLPVQRARIVVDVDQAIATVTQTHTFTNDRSAFIEGTYVFPLPEDASVDGMVMHIADRTIEGRVEERDTAWLAYRNAVAQGRIATLTQESRPNVFLQRVGNIPPGASIDVTLTLVQPVDQRNGYAELVLPVVVAPRFIPASDRPNIEPGPRLGDTPVETQVSVSLTSATPIIDLHSPSHAGLTSLEASATPGVPHQARFELNTPGQRDVVLRWSMRRQTPTAHVLLQRGPNDAEHALLIVDPPADVSPADRVARELVWVIDQSCSMRGAPLTLTQRAMQQLVDDLDERDSVWLLPSTAWLEGESEPQAVTPWRQTLVRGRIASLEATGPTPLFEGLTLALEHPLDPRRERAIIVVSDGLVADDWSVLQQVADQLGPSRLFSIGAGPSPNRFLLEELARIGGGTSTFLRQGEDPEATVARFLRTIQAPVLTDVGVDWGDWVVDEVTPDRWPAVYANQPLQLTAIVRKRGTTPITIRGRTVDGPWKTEVTPTVLDAGRSIPSTWARQRIRELDRDQLWRDVPGAVKRIIDLSLTYQVSSRYTAFVAIDDRPVRDPTDAIFRAEQRAAPPADATFFAPVVEASTASLESASRVVAAFTSRRTIPAGRSYQTAVSTIYFPLYRRASFVGHQSILWPFDPALVQRYGATNNRFIELRHEEGLATRTDLGVRETMGAARGPVVRDAVWAEGRARRIETNAGDRSYLGHRLVIGASAQPNSSHQLMARGLVDRSTINDAFGRSDQAELALSGQWKAFPSPNFAVELQTEGRRVGIGDDRFDRLVAQVMLRQVISKHRWWAELLADRVRWQRPDGFRTRGLPQIAATNRIFFRGAYRYRFDEHWLIRAWLETHGFLGRVWPTPALWIEWEPSDWLTVTGAAGRHLTHVGQAGFLNGQPAILNEALASVELRVNYALEANFQASVRSRQNVPQVDGSSVDRDVARLAFAGRAELHPLELEVTATQQWLLTDVPGPVYSDGTLAGFAHRLEGHIAWTSNRRNPLTTEFLAGVFAQPLGNVLPDPTLRNGPNIPRWRLGNRWTWTRTSHQAIPFEISVEASWTELLGPASLDDVLRSGLQGPQVALPAFTGLRLGGTVALKFE
ncbi:MAG: VIT domain-containing protein [Myxococcota bacterium]